MRLHSSHALMRFTPIWRNLKIQSIETCESNIYFRWATDKTWFSWKYSLAYRKSNEWNVNFAKLVVKTVEAYDMNVYLTMPDLHPWLAGFKNSSQIINYALDAWFRSPIMVTILDRYFHYHWGTIFFTIFQMAIRNESMPSTNWKDLNIPAIVKHLKQKPGPTVEAALRGVLQFGDKNNILGLNATWNASAQYLEHFTKYITGKWMWTPYERLEELWSLAMLSVVWPGALTWDLWQQNLKLLKQTRERREEVKDYKKQLGVYKEQVRIYKEQLDGIRSAGVCMNYRNSLEKHVPRQTGAKGRLESQTAAWIRKWRQNLQDAQSTKTGPLWEFVKKYLVQDQTADFETIERMGREGEQLYARTSGPIHAFESTNPVWQELGPEWTIFEAGLLKLYKAQDVRENS